MSVTKEELDKYIKAYSEGNPLVSDEEYDLLCEEYVKEHGESSRPFNRNKQSSSVNDVVGTLSKLYGIKTPMRQGQKTYIEHFYNKHRLNPNIKIFLQAKFDGCSVAFDFKTERFYTRGDYDNGESVDVTELFQSKLPQMYKLNKSFDDTLKSAKFEFIMPLRVYYDLFKDDYKRPRDAASAALTSRNIDTCKMCTLIPLRMYDNENRMFVMYDIGMEYKANEFDLMQHFIDLISEHAFTFNYVINNEEEPDLYQVDGVVVSVINEIRNEDYEYTYDEGIQIDPELEAAIKIINVTQKTKLINIEYQYGSTGMITPVAIFEPVMFDNVEVDHASLANIARVINEGFRYEDTVEIMYNIVPYLVKTYNDGKARIPVPTHCPICGMALEILNDGSTVRCINPDCTGRRIGSIANYCRDIGAMGISESTISKLMEHGLIYSIADLYSLTKSDIAELPRFGDKSAENIINSIKRASTNISLPRFLGAFPINNVRSTTWETILRAIKMDDLRLRDYAVLSCDMLIEEIIQTPIKNIGAATKRNIVEGLKQNWKDIIRTMADVTFEHFDLTDKQYKEIITLTKFHDKQFIKDLLNAGYDVRDWSQNTTLLIIKDETSHSNTVDKALAAGIPIYTWEEAINKLL